MKKTGAFIFLLSLFNFILIIAAQAAEIRPIFFPTERRAVLTESFGDPRSGHAHEGEDIMGERMMPLYAAVDGRVTDLVDPESSWGYAITLKDADGFTYHYLHVNNDTPGTDDGRGGTGHAYAPGIKEGARVSRGDLIGWMGDSGNAEAAGAHLHFEIRRPDKMPIDPYPSLEAALNPVIDFDITEAGLLSPDINADKGLSANGASVCVSGSLIKLSGQSAVYYCGADGRRYVFPNERIYFSWYEGFSDVTEISGDQMAAIPLGGNATYRPGTKMVKVQTDPRVYAVARGGELRWIRSAETAAALYGADWKKKVDDLPDSFFFDYKIGQDI
ncbi:MAG: M23 family metallopeptidase [Candidatus Falkowbacteria bacterium]